MSPVQCAINEIPICLVVSVFANTRALFARMLNMHTWKPAKGWWLHCFSTNDQREKKYICIYKLTKCGSVVDADVGNSRFFCFQNYYSNVDLREISGLILSHSTPRTPTYLWLSTILSTRCNQMCVVHTFILLNAVRLSRNVHLAFMYNFNKVDVMLIRLVQVWYNKYNANTICIMLVKIPVVQFWYNSGTISVQFWCNQCQCWYNWQNTCTTWYNSGKIVQFGNNWYKTNAIGAMPGLVKFVWNLVQLVQIWYICKLNWYSSWLMLV